MKKFLVLIALVLGATVLTPSAAEARDYGGSSRVYAYSCRSCGTPVYRERCITGYDRYRRPVYSWRTCGHSCRRSGYGSGYGYGHGHNHYSGRSWFGFGYRR